MDKIINNRGLAYGDGFFSTMGVQEGQILWANYHKNRLMTHATALQLAIDANRVNDMMQNLTNQAKQMGEGVLKVIITRKPQSVKGYGFNNGEVEVLTKAMPMVIYPQHEAIGNSRLGIAEQIESSNRETDTVQKQKARHFHIRGNDMYQFSSSVTIQSYTKEFIPIQLPIIAICLKSQISCLPKPLVGLKTLNRLDNVLASAELNQQLQLLDTNFDNKIGEGLTQNVLGEWIEGTMSNVFYRLETDQTWYTPPLDNSGVDGVMRQVLMDMPALAITERKLYDKDLVNISALFFTNAVRGIIPVKNLVLPNGATITLSIY